MELVVQLASVESLGEFNKVLRDFFVEPAERTEEASLGLVYLAEDSHANCFTCSYPGCLKALRLKSVNNLLASLSLEREQRQNSNSNSKPHQHQHQNPKVAMCVQSSVVALPQLESLGSEALHLHTSRLRRQAIESPAATHARISFFFDTLDMDDLDDSTPHLRIITIVPCRLTTTPDCINEHVGQAIIATQKRLQRQLSAGLGVESRSTHHLSLARQRTCPPALNAEESRLERRHSDPPNLFAYYRTLMTTNGSDCDCGQSPGACRKVDQALLELCASLYNLTNAELQLKILKYLYKATAAQTGCILLLSQDVSELSCTCIKDRLLDAELRFPVSEENFFSKIIAARRPVLLDGAELAQSAQQHDVLFFLPIELRSLLCVPIVNRTNDSVVAVVCLANKMRNAEKEQFVMHDVCIVHRCFGYTMPVLTSVIAFQSEQRLRKQTQSLLKVAKNIFRCVDNLNQLLREIMAEASNLTGAERCSLFVYEANTNQLVARVFDCSHESCLDGCSPQKPQPQVRISCTTGIAGEVFTKGQVLNIRNAYTHPLFYKGIDQETGFKTRNILCFPLQDESGKIVAVAELCNKLNGPYFTDADAEIAMAFGMFCCISLAQSLMYNRVQEEHYRAKLANELMTYHMHLPEENVESLAALGPESVTVFLPNFDSFASIPRDVPEKDTLRAVVSMFDDLGFTSLFRINRMTLSRFVHAVKLGYRDPPYHNWMHAFSAAHFAYLCMKNCPTSDYLTAIERFALLVASLCHDIDHRGTNNSFQVVSKSTLACLYSSAGSVLERHHVAQTLCLLNADGSQILENLSDSDYKLMIDRIRDIILATDVANHLRIFDKIQGLTNGRFDRSNDDHHVLLVSLLMTAADLSDQTKKWSNSKRASSLIYQEFFSQGDLEKQLGHSPSPMMDRARACVPELQVSFLDGIAIPVYETLGVLFPEAASVATQSKRNRENWKALLDKLKAGELKENVDIFQERLVDDDFDLGG